MEYAAEKFPGGLTWYCRGFIPKKEGEGFSTESLIGPQWAGWINVFCYQVNSRRTQERRDSGNPYSFILRGLVDGDIPGRWIVNSSLPEQDAEERCGG